MKDSRAYDKNVIYLHVVYLGGADNPIGRLLWPDNLDIWMPVRWKIRMQSVHEYTKIRINLVLYFFFSAGR